MRAARTVAICLTLAGCGLPPVVDGARFLVLSDSGVESAQLDFPDQRSCLAAQRVAADGAARCRRTTMWNAFRVNADVDLPDRTRIDGHFTSMARCERPDSLAQVGGTVVLPCVPTAPER